MYANNHEVNEGHPTDEIDTLTVTKVSTSS